MSFDPKEQPQNLGALGHHLHWAVKLLMGAEPETLPDGEYVLAFKVQVTKGNVQFLNWSLEGEAPDDATVAQPTS